MTHQMRLYRSISINPSVDGKLTRCLPGSTMYLFGGHTPLVRRELSQSPVFVIATGMVRPCSCAAIEVDRARVSHAQFEAKPKLLDCPAPPNSGMKTQTLLRNIQ